MLYIVDTELDLTLFQLVQEIQRVKSILSKLSSNIPRVSAHLLFHSMRANQHAASSEYLSFDELLTPRDQQIRYTVRQFAQLEIAPVVRASIANCTNRVLIVMFVSRRSTIFTSAPSFLKQSFPNLAN